MDIDLTNLTIRQVIALALTLAAVDFLGSVALAVKRGTFAFDLVLTVLRTHVLAKVFPIIALAVLGHGIPALDVPALAPAALAATAALALYALETTASLRDSWGGDNLPAGVLQPVFGTGEWIGEMAEAEVAARIAAAPIDTGATG